MIGSSQRLKGLAIANSLKFQLLRNDIVGSCQPYILLRLTSRISALYENIEKEQSTPCMCS